MPNVVPPRGHIPMLETYLESNPSSQPLSISTFGFGYSLDSPLLLQIAQVGGGGYSFIPDSGMVGTVFVHAVANTYSTYAPRAKLSLEIPEGIDVEVKGGLPVVKTSWGAQIDAGDIQFGQTRDYVFVFSKLDPAIAATLTYRSYTSAEEVKSNTAVLGTDKEKATDPARIQYNRSRLEFVEILYTTKTSDLRAIKKNLEALKEGMSTITDYPDAEALFKDVSGEGLLALESNNFSRWGRHYLPSLALSHQRQQCGNFKDPGLQVYGRDSKIFIEEREKLDTAFDGLPPPKPSIPARNNAPRAQLNSMSAYYSSAGPCFSGRCNVAIPGGGTVTVDQLKRGMEIQTLTGSSTVAAVVRTSIPSGSTQFSIIDGLEVTPWHPILFSGKWVFPADIEPPQVVACDAVYSILLIKGQDDEPTAHSISVGGTWCVTLGHGLTTGDDVRAHSFLGNYERVLESISMLPGFHNEDGIAKCAGTARSVADGNICGFAGESAALVDVKREPVMVACV